MYKQKIDCIYIYNKITGIISLSVGKVLYCNLNLSPKFAKTNVTILK